MALPVLDGNQSATTLSSVVTGGEHIVAHTVVSLGSTAISNITSAVSGSSVSISNFPATQTIAGTVTANVANYSATAVSYSGSSVTGIPVVLQTNGVYGGTLQGYNGVNSYVHVGLESVGGNSLRFGGTLPVSGTVTIGSLPAISGTVTVSSLPASTVTVGAMPNGSLTTRFGTPTTANTAFATSAVTNASRKYLLIQNVTTGSNVITVGIGFTPTTTQGIQLTAGAGITFESSYIPTGAVYVLVS